MMKSKILTISFIFILFSSMMIIILPPFSSSSNLEVQLAFVGGSGTESNPYQISDWNDLDNVRNNLSANYTLVNDIDKNTAGYDNLASNTANGGDGWNPIGDTTTPFIGNFEGRGYVISNLYISRASRNDVGLFGSLDGKIITTALTDVNIYGDLYVGGLVGWNTGIISESYITGSMDGDFYIGGLVGSNKGTIKNSYATGDVSGDGDVGGLIGQNNGIVTNSYATAKVIGSASDVGGLVGRNSEVVAFNAINYSYANSETSGQSSLVGENSGTINGGGMRTTAEMTDYYDYPNCYNDTYWDFDDIWQATSWNTDQEGNSGYPALSYGVLPDTKTTKTADKMIEYWSPFGENINQSREIKIEFADEMDKSSVEYAFSFSTSSNTYDISNGTVQWPNNKTFNFNPDFEYKSEGKYTVELSTEAQNQSGTYLASDFTWNFITEDTNPPEVISKSPTGNNVPIDTKIKITFDDAPDKSSVRDAFKLEGPHKTYTSSDGTVSWNGNQFIFDPEGTLYKSNQFDSMEYTVMLEDSAQDTNGNHMESDCSWTFTTEGEDIGSLEYIMDVILRLLPFIIIGGVVIFIGIWLTKNLGKGESEV